MRGSCSRCASRRSWTGGPRWPRGAGSGSPPPRPSTGAPTRGCARRSSGSPTASTPPRIRCSSAPPCKGCGGALPRPDASPPAFFRPHSALARGTAAAAPSSPPAGVGGPVERGRVDRM
uniref:Uncharacterized protein n=1 Tax=Arundo donax TaxID=35708 RepID=A0A0A9APK7_ARUDO